jgi:hypothetical protein
MKRLIKSANTIIDWLQSGHGFISNSEIDNIIKENYRYLFIGAGYRYLGFDNNEILNLFGGYNSMDGDTTKINKKDIFDKLSTLLNIDDKYCSFSKSLDAAKNYSLESDNRGTITVIVRSVISGLDINAYLELNSKNIDIEEVSQYVNEEEVISKLDNDVNIVYFLNKNIAEWPENISLNDLAEAIMDNRL